MIVHNCEQRSDEWFELRSGKLTASLASKLITPTGKASVQYRGEIARLIAERAGLQEVEDIPQTFWMQRGVELEPQARAWFEVETGHDVLDVGFIESGSGLIGGSPDGLIVDPITGKMIPLELKVPKPSTHIKWLLEAQVPKDHIAQVHFQMILTGSNTGYFSSYCPDVEPLIVMVEWDDYTETLLHQIDKYESEFTAGFERITGEQP